MSEEEIAKALTPFGQIDNKMTATHNGTGLGLPLAKAMLELHGGTLAITSAPRQRHHGDADFPGRARRSGASAAAA